MLKRLLLPLVIACGLLIVVFILLPSPSVLAQLSHSPPVAPATGVTPALATDAITQASVYTYTLSSGNVAVIEMSTTAGEIITSTLLLCLLAVYALEMIFKVIYRRK